MRNYGECLPNNCLNWLALGACIYNGKKNRYNATDGGVKRCNRNSYGCN